MPAQSYKYKDSFCEDLVNHMAEGYSFKSFAGLKKVTVQCLEKWVKDKPDFEEAKKLGEAASLLRWEKICIAGTMGKIKNFNSNTFVFNMKNRFNWSDRADLRITGDFSESVQDHELLKSVNRADLIKLVSKPAKKVG